MLWRFELSVVSARREIAEGARCHAPHQVERGVRAGKSVGVEQAHQVLVISVSGKLRPGLPTRVTVVIGPKRCSEACNQTLDFGARRLIARRRGEPRQARNVLPKGVPGSECVGVVPAPHVRPRRRKPRALAINLEHLVFVEREVRAVNALELVEQRPAGQLHVWVIKCEESLPFAFLGRTSSTGARAGLRCVALARRGTAHGGRRVEGVGRAGVARAVAALGHVADAC